MRAVVGGSNCAAVTGDRVPDLRTSSNLVSSSGVIPIHSQTQHKCAALHHLHRYQCLSLRSRCFGCLTASVLFCCQDVCWRCWKWCGDRDSAAASVTPSLAFKLEQASELQPASVELRTPGESWMVDRGCALCWCTLTRPHPAIPGRVPWYSGGRASGERPDAVPDTLHS